MVVIKFVMKRLLMTQSTVTELPEQKNVIVCDGVTNSDSLLDKDNNVYDIVKNTGKPNFLQARIPVQSQLNVNSWEEALVGYWDRQLLELIKFSFLPDFNRACDLGQYLGNHTSGTDWPGDLEAYIKE